MNHTHNGRWYRFRISSSGEREKKCNGPLHDKEGAWVPLENFWIFKKGPRAGKAHNWCIPCSKVKRGRDSVKSGWVKVSEVAWVFMELQRRLGKTEVIRRLDLSTGFWTRSARQTYYKKETVRKALILLAECRRDGVVRHRKSIRHGASMRGHTERTPVGRKDFYHITGDDELENRRNYRQQNLEMIRAKDNARRKRKRDAKAKM